jgi:chromosome transmission fidelity protein 18
MTSEYGSDFSLDFLRSESYPHDQLGDHEATHSDDLRIREAHLADITADKNRRGIVIQHRAWTVNQAFLSDQERPTKSPSAKYSRGVLPSSSQMPSSPPIDLAMATTPATENESPGKMASARKRIRLDEPRSPLKPINGNAHRTIGGFIIESDDEDEDEDEKDLIHKPTTSLPEFSSFLKSPISSPAVQANAVESVLETELELPTLEPAIQDQPRPELLKVTTSSGKATYIGPRLKQQSASYERIVAGRSVTEEGKATKSFYGIDMHNLLEEIQLQKTILKAEKETAMEVQYAPPEPVRTKSSTPQMLWTEKYRAKKFTDLVGDERTHRLVMHWLKSWDSIVFPGLNQAKKGFKKRDAMEEQNQPRHAKVLLLTGPPGLGKTTLAHVCARQAGYEVHEINASDDRKVDVVKNKIRDMVGTENVRGVNSKTVNGEVVRKAGRPVCVVVDEVDGATGSRGEGEGGFIKALIDLIQMDQKSQAAGSKKSKKGKFRFLRPLILVCNDVYHPSLRPLRQSSLAEIVHVRKPAIQMVSARLHSIFEREGVQSDADGIRRLCEATWGVSSRKDAVGFSGGTSDGDVRSVLVVGEWVATRFKAKRVPGGDMRLTKRWIEEQVLSELAYGGSAVRSLGRGSTKEVVERVFLHDAGFLKTPMESQAQGHGGVGGTGAVGVAEAGKRKAMIRLKDLTDACGEIDRVITGKFAPHNFTAD